MFRKVAQSQKVDKYRNCSAQLLRYFLGFHTKLFHDFEPPTAELPDEELHFWHNVVKNFALPVKNGTHLSPLTHADVIL